MATVLLTNDVIGARERVVISASATVGALNDVFGDNLNLDPIQSVGVQVTGTFVGTLAFEVSNDKTTWLAKSLVNPSAGSVNNATAPGLFSGDIGARYFRVRFSAYTSGTATINIYGTSESQSSASATITGTPTVNLGTGGTGATSLGKAEDAVAASGDTGIATFGVRAPATPAAQTSAPGDYGSISIDTEGKQIISGTANPDVAFDSNINLTTTSDVALRAAQAAGIRTFVKLLVLENTGASASRVLLRDGTTTRATFTLAAGQTLVVPFEQPLRGTAATALNAQLGAAGTVTVTTVGYSGV